MHQGGHAAFIFSEVFMEYDFGPLHPLRPERLRLLRERLQADGGAVTALMSAVVEAQPATEEEVSWRSTPGNTTTRWRRSAPATAS